MPRPVEGADLQRCIRQPNCTEDRAHERCNLTEGREFNGVAKRGIHTAAVFAGPNVKFSRRQRVDGFGPE